MPLTAYCQQVDSAIKYLLSQEIVDKHNQLSHQLAQRLVAEVRVLWLCAALVCSAHARANKLADAVVAESVSVAIVASVIVLGRSVAMRMLLLKF